MQTYIFISGISSGIGEDSTRLLLNQGYHVIGTVRKEADKLRLEERYGDQLSCLICDITDDHALDEVVKETKTIIGDDGLFALINNAGIAVPGPMHLVTDEDFDKQMDVNLIATRKLTNRLIPYMTDQRKGYNPRIIFISSVSGVFAAPFNGPYCVSKHALECMIDIYRRELKYLNIDVVSIQPGPIKTKIWSKVKGKFDVYKKGPFEQIAARADHIINSTEKLALPVERISNLVLQILERKKNKNRYMVHKNATMLKLVAYCLPSSVVDKMVWKNLEKTDSDTYRPV